MPSAARDRLHGLFKEVEKEFEALYLENSRLRERVSRLEKGEGGRDDDRSGKPDGTFKLTSVTNLQIKL